MYFNRAWFIRAVVATHLFCLSALPALAEKRVALVIGNAAYTGAAVLKNPRHDAEDMTAALQRLNFKVISGYDLDERGMSLKAREFSKELIGADVALFFYAGHGLQVNGLNYLAPTNVALKSEADLDFETLPLDLVLKQMRQAKISLVFLDACRDNPLTRGLKAASRSGTGSTGLARIEDATGMMISFATQPGNIALDGEGRNSPYSKALLAHMAKPGVSVSDTMIEVRKQVLAETGDKQVPWENSSLTGKFYFMPGAAVGGGMTVAAASPQQTVTKEVLTVADSAVDHTFWTSVATTDDRELYREYLRRFPAGSYRMIAQAKLAALSQPRSSEPPVLPLSLSPKAMAEELQKELRRVGCFAESPDGVWGAESMRAMATYNAQARTALPIDTPSREAISTLKAQTRNVCAVEAAVPPPPAAKPSRKKVVEKVEEEEKPRAKRSSTSSSSSSSSSRESRSSQSSGRGQNQGQERDSSTSVGTAIIGGAIVGGIIGGVLSQKKK